MYPIPPWIRIINISVLIVHSILILLRPDMPPPPTNHKPHLRPAFLYLSILHESLHIHKHLLKVETVQIILPSNPCLLLQS